MSRSRLCSKRSQAQVPACLDDVRSISCFSQVVSTGVHTSLVLLPSKLADVGKTQAMNTQWKLLENVVKPWPQRFNVCSLFDVKEREAEVFSSAANARFGDTLALIRA